MPYTALILAAGYGNRMKPFTNKRHKSLIEVAGKTILEMIIESLIYYGVENYCIVTGYKSEDIVDFVSRKFKNINVHYVHNNDFYKTNNIYSVSLALNQLNTNDDIFLIESDLIFKREIIKTLFDSKYENAALISKYILGMDGTVIDKIGDRVSAVYPPHLHDKEFNFKDKYKTLNIYKFSNNDLSVAEFIFDTKNRKKILEKSHGGYWNFPIEDFTFIRNFYYPTDSMISSMNRYIDKLIFNYGSSQLILNRKVSFLESCSDDSIIALSGAAQVYPILRNYFGDKKVAMPDITFGEYTRVFKYTNLYNDLFNDNYDLNSVINISDIVCIINPNNPTGKLIDTDYIYDKARNNKDKIFIIDESFIDYSDQPTIINFLDDDPLENILVIKSLSKAHGVPGLRLGYIYTKNKLIYNYIMNNLPIWNMNSIAEYFLEISLKYRSDLKQSFIHAKSDRSYLVENLKNIPFISKVLDSNASFVTFLIKDPRWSNGLSEYLLISHNIYLKELSRIKDKNGSKYFRVALTNTIKIDFLINSLQEYFISKQKEFNK